MQTNCCTKIKFLISDNNLTIVSINFDVLFENAIENEYICELLSSAIIKNHFFCVVLCVKFDNASAAEDVQQLSSTIMF